MATTPKSADKAEGSTKSTDAPVSSPTASTRDTGEKLNKPVPSVGPDNPAYHEQYQETQQQLATAQRPAEEGDEDAEPLPAYDEKGSFHG